MNYITVIVTRLKHTHMHTQIHSNNTNTNNTNNKNIRSNLKLLWYAVWDEIVPLISEAWVLIWSQFDSNTHLDHSEHGTE